MRKIEDGVKTTPTFPRSPVAVRPRPDAAAEIEPLFTSAHCALKFAMNFSHGTVKKSFLAAAQGKSGPAGKGLGGLDGAAQAGLILAELSNLEPVRRNIIVAWFTTAYSPCACRSPCCRGQRETPSWAEAVNYLTEYVLALGLTGTVSHYRLRRTLVMRFFGVKDSFVEMALACGVHRTTASEHNKAVSEFLKREHRLGLYDIEGRLKRAQIVEN